MQLMDCARWPAGASGFAIKGQELTFARASRRKRAGLLASRVRQLTAQTVEIPRIDRSCDEVPPREGNCGIFASWLRADCYARCLLKGEL